MADVEVPFCPRGFRGAGSRPPVVDAPRRVLHRKNNPGSLNQLQVLPIQKKKQKRRRDRRVSLKLGSIIGRTHLP